MAPGTASHLAEGLLAFEVLDCADAVTNVGEICGGGTGFAPGTPLSTARCVCCVRCSGGNDSVDETVWGNVAPGVLLFMVRTFLSCEIKTAGAVY